MDTNTGLVLEGGGMRGVFTSGALDYFMDRGLRFPYCVSVSAGACNGLSYKSLQRGRAKVSNIDLLERYGYIGMKYLWTQHSILDQEFMYERIPQDVLPYDYAACFANPMTFEMVTTNCRTGQACYLTEERDAARLIAIAKASSSLPFVCPIVMLDGEPMLDGGIVDSIPVERAMATGHAFNVAILTRERGFRKRGADIRMPRFVYRNYPRLRVVLSKMNAAYNRQLELVERLEDEGRLLTIRPEGPVEVGRLEKDVAKLNALYRQGYRRAREAVERFVASHPGGPLG